MLARSQLCLLDFSPAFDTIDHTILLKRLDEWFDVTGKALDWLKSELTGRCQRIKQGDCLSSKTDLTFGVLQGSVLGPLLFTLHSTPLSSMISEHDIPHHLHDDVSQLYVSFASGDSAAVLNGLQSYLASAHSWMSRNILRLNPDKTEFLLVGKKNSEANTSLCFLLSCLMSKLTQQILLEILEKYLPNSPPSTHIYQPCAAHAFTVSRICSVFAVTLI